VREKKEISKKVEEGFESSKDKRQRSSSTAWDARVSPLIKRAS